MITYKNGVFGVIDRNCPKCGSDPFFYSFDTVEGRYKCRKCGWMSEIERHIFWESKEKQFVQKVSEFMSSFKFVKEDMQAGGCTEWRNWKWIKDGNFLEIDVFDNTIRVWYDKKHEMDGDVYEDIEEFKEEIVELFKCDYCNKKHKSNYYHNANQFKDIYGDFYKGEIICHDCFWDYAWKHNWTGGD